MDTERIRKIEGLISSSGGINNYISQTYDNPEMVSDLSYYIHHTIKQRVSECNKCETSDINNLLISLYPILSTEDAEKIVQSRRNGITINSKALDSYISLEEIKNKMTSIPNECIKCFKEKSSNKKLNDSRTCANDFGINDVDEALLKFNCPEGYTDKDNLELINCPDQNKCNVELCCNIKDDNYYFTTIFNKFGLVIIGIFILFLLNYMFKIIFSRSSVSKQI